MDKNRLGEETSPYLLQHRDNPVHWQAWNEETLAAAKAADKPILLSVGYAACHWCHVMAHESFEDPEIAAAMNRLYVNIKVDREERPDLDQIYQHALSLMGEQGGWPLDDVPDAAGRAVLGRHLFPARCALGPAGISPGAGGDQRGLCRETRRCGEECRGVARGVAAAGPAAARWCDRPRAARPDRRAAVARDRPDPWRYRDRAQIPAMRHPSSCCGAAGSEPARPPIATP